MFVAQYCLKRLNYIGTNNISATGINTRLKTIQFVQN